MNPDVIRGAVKSRSNRVNTLIATGVSLAAAKYGWDLSPAEMAWLVSAIFLVANFILRSITSQSLEEKGYKPPNQKTVDIIKKEVIKEIAPYLKGDPLIQIEPVPPETPDEPSRKSSEIVVK